MYNAVNATSRIKLSAKLLDCTVSFTCATVCTTKCLDLVSLY